MKTMKTIIDVLGADKLDSLTKYPSIETFHIMDRGILRENETNLTEEFGDRTLLVQEKIDGTNMRIIVSHDGYIIGSRNQLLSYRDDLIWSDLNAIMTKSFAEMIFVSLKDTEILKKHLLVFYGELYGGNIGKASRQYTKNKDLFCFRLFDVAKFDTQKVIEELFQTPVSSIKGLKRKYQNWIDITSHQKFDGFLEPLNEMNVKKVPAVGVYKLSKLDEDIETVYKTHLSVFSKSQAKEEEGAKGKSEGIIVRDEKRNFIRKLRFEDYQKTLRKQKKPF